MEPLPKNPTPPFEPIVTDFPNQARGVQFKKDTLVEELLSLGHAKITPQIAKLIGDEVEQAIHRRKLHFLSTDLISELVEEKLGELGLIRTTPTPTRIREDVIPLPLNTTPQELPREVLEVIVPGGEGFQGELTLPQKGVQKTKPQFSEAALSWLTLQVFVKDEKGVAVENGEEMLGRVAKTAAAANLKYNPTDHFKQTETDFYNLLASGDFLPSPTILANAGRTMGLLASSYVLPLTDSMESIFDAMKQAAVIHKFGGNTGFSFSELRPRTDSVKTAPGTSSGPVSFMKVYNAATDAVREGGKPGAYNRGLLRVDHPDLEELLHTSTNEKSLSHFRVSIGITDAFISACVHDSFFDLKNPRTGEAVRKVKARAIMQKIAEHIQNTGEPNLVFIDRMETSNPTPLCGAIAGVDPNGIQPLSAFEAIPYGALNLARFAANGKIEWGKMKLAVEKAVTFLDNMLEVSPYPLPESEKATKANRKIGLGVMGWADMLKTLGLDYESPEAENLAGQLMAFVSNEAVNASQMLARKRGAYANYDKSLHADIGSKRRNAVVTAIYPTQALALLAGVTPGLEPSVSSKSWEDVSLEGHLKIQNAFQKNTENNVFKLIPLPEKAGGEVTKWILLAHHMGLKSLQFVPHSLFEKALDPFVNPLYHSHFITPGSQEPNRQIDLNLLSGTTRRLKTACGEMTVTLNGAQDRLVELLVHLGETSSCTASQMEALTRVISLALKKGVEGDAILKAIEGIRCGEHKPDSPEEAASYADGLALAMRQEE